MFSNENGNKSENKSDRFTATIIKITNDDLTDNEKDNIISDTRFIVRKLAHFTLYFILGILMYLTLRSYGIEKNIIIYSILGCMLYAISDEVHQLFTDGRSFKVYDIIIDTLGSTTSITISNLINKKRK